MKESTTKSMANYWACIWIVTNLSDHLKVNLRGQSHLQVLYNKKHRMEERSAYMCHFNDFIHRRRF